MHFFSIHQTRLFLLLLLLLLSFALPQTALAAMGCCVLAPSTKVEPTEQNVKGCLPLQLPQSCITWAELQQPPKPVGIFEDKSCKELAYCAQKLPANCCKAVQDGGTVNCYDTHTANTCKLLLENSPFQPTFAAAACGALPECAGKLGTEQPKPPAPAAPAPAELKIPTIAVPKLSIPIPGVGFSQIKVQEAGAKKFIDVPWIAQYIQGVYNYVLGAVAVLAIAMIALGGIKWLSAGGNPEQISSAKKNIQNALIGVLLAFGSYAILYTINPNLVSLSVLRIDVARRIAAAELVDMNKKYGFKDPAAAAENEKKAEEEAIKASGGGDLISPAETGEKISIDGLNPTGDTPAKRMFWYCSKKEDEPKLTTYDEKISALVRVILGWEKECIKNKGCAYVRGGYTGADGKIFVGANDTPWLLNHLTRRGTEPGWSTDCATKWRFVLEAYGGEQGFYKNRNPKNPPEDLRPFEYNVGDCWKQLQEQYKKDFISILEKNGIFGTDCGGFVVEAYQCAKGKTWASITDIIHYYGRDPNKYIVYDAKNLVDFNTQLKNKGGLKFGDIFIIGKENRQHNFMFTGGRDDVPFEWIEMGAWDGGGVGPCANAPGYPGGCQTGVHIHPKGSNFFFWADNFPVSVARPYEFEPCQSKADCNDGEVCLCTVLDAKDPEKCSLKNVCHKAKQAPLYCNNDEMCAKGWSCAGKACKKD